MIKKNKKFAFSLIELSIVLLIIGILIAGVTSSSRLIAEFKLSSARAKSQGSPVNSIKGLYFWLDSTAEKAIDGDVDYGSGVDNFYDQNIQSSVKLDFLQTDSTKRPVYNKDLINGLPALVFDGVDDFLQSNVAIAISDIAPENENTIFFVGNIYHDDAMPFPGYFNIQDSTGAQRIYFTSFSGASRFTYVEDITNSINGGSLLGGSKIVTLENRKQVQSIYLNGELSVAATTTAEFDNFTSNFYIGSQDGTQNFAKMDVGEIIVFNRALKNEEREDVERYLSEKWKININ